MPASANEYAYRTVSELRKVASVAAYDSERQRDKMEERPRERPPGLIGSDSSSQVK